LAIDGSRDPICSASPSHHSVAGDDGSGDGAAGANAIGGDHSRGHAPLNSFRRRSFPQERPLLPPDANAVLLLQQHRR